MEMDHNILEESVQFFYSGYTSHLQEGSDAPTNSVVEVSTSY